MQRGPCRYEARKKEVEKLVPVIKAAREAPTLVLADGRQDVPAKSTLAAIASHSTPSSLMERQVAQLLEQSRAKSAAAVAQAEEEAAAKVGRIPVAE